MFIEAETINGIIGQLGTLVVTKQWRLTAPPAHLMRGVDFYNGTDLVFALSVATQLFKNAHGYIPRLDAPRTYNEHIFVRKFFAPMPVPSLADKLGVRGFVQARLGESVLVPVVWTGETVEELYAADLPAGRFALKANHGAGMNLFLDLPGDLTVRRDEIMASTEEWRQSRFGYTWGEWHYNIFKRRLFLEAFLGRPDGLSMDDIKVHCFHGKARLINLTTGRRAEHRIAQYTPDWRRIPVDIPGFESIEFPRPPNLETIIDAAQRLARGLDYARIDLYSDGQRIWFGEITLTPGNGNQAYADPRYDEWLGGLFDPNPAQPEWLG
jgi:hypothetical protein